MATESWRRNHRPNGWHNVVPPTIPVSTRKCVGCRQPLAKSLLDADPDTLTHAACTEAGPITDWERWRVVQQKRRAFALRSQL